MFCKDVVFVELSYKNQDHCRPLIYYAQMKIARNSTPENNGYSVRIDFDT